MRFVVFLSLVLWVNGWAPRAKAHGFFVVNTTADSDDGSCGEPPAGDCSLREAITAANAAMNDHPDAPDSIGFDFGPGAAPPFTIQLGAPLPTITESLVIDGRSEPRYIVGTARVPVIVINGGGFDEVFRVRADNTLIVSLALTDAAVSGIDAEDADFLLVRDCYFGIHPDTGARLGDDPQQPAFGAHAIRVTASERPRIGGEGDLAGNVIAGAGAEALVIEGGDDLVLIGNHIGVDPTGQGARPNALRDPSAFAVVIDGAGSAQVKNNVISANLGAGLRIVDVPSASVEQNRVGVDSTGRVGMGNGSSGIRLEGDLDGLLLRGNIISDNAGDGVVCAAAATGEWAMLSNVVGIDQGQSRVLPNLGHGVAIMAGCDGAAIGASSVNQGNVIAHNGKAGIRLTDGMSSARGNSVFLNRELGIDAGQEGVTSNDVSDAVLPVNFPEVRAMSRVDGSLVIEGCAVAGAAIDVYQGSVDPSGYGEGMRHLGSIVEGGALDVDDATGCSPENDASFSLTLDTEVSSVTLTATSRRRTSEFSSVYTEPGQNPDPGCDSDASCESPTPICNPASRNCEVCIDDAEVGRVDSGCDEGAPRCVVVAGAASRCLVVDVDVAEPARDSDAGCSLTQMGTHGSKGQCGFLILAGLILAWRREK